MAAALPNLTPYQPSGWSDKIVVATTTGTTTDSATLYTTNTLYVDWAVVNNGNAAITGTFYDALYVDGKLKNSWSQKGLAVNYYAYVKGYSIGSLSAGTHTIKITADSTGVITESNESDNSYTKTITVTAPSGSQVAAPSFSPVPGTYISAQSVTITTATSGATIRYTVDGTTPTTQSTLYKNAIIVSNTTEFKAIAIAPGVKQSAVTTVTYTIQPEVVLLLHGMNSDPITWNSFLTSSESTYFNNNMPTPPVLLAGVAVSGKEPTVDQYGVFYYLIQFGAFDVVDGVKGLEGITSATSPGPTSTGSGGDFTPFSGTDSLAQEVNDAITGILAKHPGAKILLVGHSRGGLAARAFLESSTYGNNREAVVGLLTVGTPHLGSPLGRLYNFLSKNPRTKDSNDWQLVDDLRGANTSFLIPYLNELDVRRPTIGYLATGSSAIDALATDSSSLPTTAEYGTLMFDGATFGLVYSGIGGSLNVFKGGRILFIYSYPALTANASNAVCLSTPIGEFLGDGIVPYSFQTFTAKGIAVKTYSDTTGVLHTSEPSEEADIRNAMAQLVKWWP